MAQDLGTIGSITDTVNFSEQLGTALQAIVEIFLDDEEPLWVIRDITSDIHSISSTLRRLQNKINTDDSKENPRVFKDAGLKEIEELSLRCGKTYKTVLALVDKAVCLKAGGEGREILRFNTNMRNSCHVGLLVRSPLLFMNQECNLDFPFQGASILPSS